MSKETKFLSIAIGLLQGINEEEKITDKTALDAPDPRIVNILVISIALTPSPAASYCR